MVDLFQSWDSDRSGGISKKELKTALRDTGITHTSGDIDRLFSKWDRGARALTRAVEATARPPRHATAALLTSY